LHDCFWILARLGLRKTLHPPSSRVHLFVYEIWEHFSLLCMSLLWKRRRWGLEFNIHFSFSNRFFFLVCNLEQSFRLDKSSLWFWSKEYNQRMLFAKITQPISQRQKQAARLALIWKWTKSTFTYQEGWKLWTMHVYGQCSSSFGDSKPLIWSASTYCYF